MFLRLLAGPRRAAPRSFPAALTLSLPAQDEPVSVLLRVDARARRYSLRLSHGGGPVLTMPAAGSVRTARRFLEDHRGWLAARLADRPAPVPFSSGAVIPVRGVAHRILATGGMRGLVKVREEETGPVLLVPGEETHLSRRLTDWLKRQARSDLEAAVAGHAARLGVRPAGLAIRDTRSRWGSCSSSRRLSFSWRLVLAPPPVLDYLAAHEVAHLREMNHGPRFWRHVAALCPDMEAQRDWLKREGARLHLYG